jgi:hypothetical protein
MKPTLWRWTLLFAALGLLLPAIFLARYIAFGKSFGPIEGMLWPSSIMFLALDVPNGTHRPASDLAIIYGIALLENVIQYAIIGALAWSALWGIRRFALLLGRHRSA